MLDNAGCYDVTALYVICPVTNYAYLYIAARIPYNYRNVYGYRISHVHYKNKTVFEWVPRAASIRNSFECHYLRLVSVYGTLEKSCSDL